MNMRYTPEEGGGRVVAVALLPAANGPTIGAYFVERKVAPFV
ncbi:hypothetical protein ACP4OV_008411 [Aristida adscensionis]